jgi:hypothetical protein
MTPASETASLLGDGLRHSHPSWSVSTGANFGQPSALPCVVALKLFVFTHGPRPASFPIQSVGHFDKSRFHGFYYAPRVHHVIILPDLVRKEGSFCVLFCTPGEPPSPRRVGCCLGVLSIRQGPKGQDKTFISAPALLLMRPRVRFPLESDPRAPAS